MHGVVRVFFFSVRNLSPPFILINNLSHYRMSIFIFIFILVEQLLLTIVTIICVFYYFLFRVDFF
jgi:hypothetical protein